MTQEADAAREPAAYTVLVADDESTLLRLMSFVMTKQGYTLLTATNGEEALQAVREQRPDLLVLDIMMPRMDGYEVAEAVRADPSLAYLPIVMLSARAQEADIERGLAAGVDTYITKPFEPEHLVETVAALLVRDTRRQAETA